MGMPGARGSRKARARTKELPAASKTTRILLADDSTTLRTALADLLTGKEGLRVVAQAADGEEAVRQAQDSVPDLVLMDTRMPLCDGITATHRIKQALPNTRVIMLSVSEDEDPIEALKAGAEGYLLKTPDTEKLAATVQRVAAGYACFSPPVVIRLLQELSRQAKCPPPQEAPRAVTAREMDVLRMVSQGCTNQDVAEELHLTLGTVKAYVHGILDKLHVRSRTEAAAWFRQQSQWARTAGSPLKV